MRFAVLITGHPGTSNASRSALRFCRAALQGGHAIVRAFFLHEASLQATDGVSSNADLTMADWQQLARQYSFDLDLCVASADKRGIDESNLANGFQIRGLGQLIDASLQADRTITFN